MRGNLLSLLFVCTAFLLACSKAPSTESSSGSSGPGVSGNIGDVVGMPYSQARKLAIALGWKPEPSQEEVFDLAAEHRQRGYVEVDTCSQGVSYCNFVFVGPNAGRLTVTTVGEIDDPKVASISLQGKESAEIAAITRQGTQDASPTAPSPPAAQPRASTPTPETATSTAKVAPTAPAFVQEAKANGLLKGTKLNFWQDQGAAINPSTRVFLYVNQFREPEVVYIDSLGIDPNGNRSVPMWRYRFQYECKEGRGYVSYNHFFGPEKTARLYFDGNPDFIEMPEDVVVDKPLLNKLRHANTLKVLHGFDPKEIAFSYDLAGLHEGLASIAHLCAK